MKILFYVLVGLILTLSVGSYLFIPNKIVISAAGQAESSQRIVSKYLQGQQERLIWWPAAKNSAQAKTDRLNYNNELYEFKNPIVNSVSVDISAGDANFKSNISWVSYAGNLMRLTWRAELPAGNSPIERISKYQQARKIKADMSEIMDHYLKFIVNHKNIYGHNFRIEKVTDTLLATTQFNTLVYPDNTEIYESINRIRKYLALQGIRPTKAPMLNVSPAGNGRYETTVALPVSKRFVPGGAILLRNMVPGNILVADVRGGRKSVEDGFNQMEMFMQDFRLGSPAVHFESLITDRRSEPDTSKWITKIYYPIY